MSAIREPDFFGYGDRFQYVTQLGLRQAIDLKGAGQCLSTAYPLLFDPRQHALSEHDLHLSRHPGEPDQLFFVFGCNAETRGRPHRIGDNIGPFREERLL